MAFNYPHDGPEVCKECNGPLTVFVIPEGLFFGVLGCVACKVRLKKVRWPKDRSKWLLAADDECSSCKAPILFVKTAKGKSTPVDVKPVQVIDGEGSLITGHMSHFATCPSADKHRKRGKA